MASNPSTAPEVCSRLQDRLREAEARTREALAVSDPNHPLVDAATQLLGIHREIRDLLIDNFQTNTSTRKVDDPEVVEAAIQIEREQHEPKAHIVDVLKALFMWRDDPVERVGKPQSPKGA